MSQVGTIVSVNHAQQKYSAAVISYWCVQYQYNLDAGGTAEAQVFVGTGFNASTGVGGTVPVPRIDPWATPSSTITVVPDPTGCTNPVTLVCPDIVKVALFGTQISGFPTVV